MTEHRVDLSEANGIARIRFVRPAANNAMDLQCLQEFAAAALACEQNAALKVIIVEGSGQVFSVGGDLRDFVAHRDYLEAHVLEMARHYHLGVASLRNAAAPVLAAVQGMAAGGGFSLVLSADLAIAAQSARFNPAYTRSGVTPDGGGTYFLPRIVGARKAFELFAFNPTLTAAQALELGIVSRVVADEDFAAAIDAYAANLAAALPGTLSALKRLLHAGVSNSLEQHLDAEARSIAALAASPSTLASFDRFLDRSGK